MDQAERWPDRMVAAKYESIARATKNRLHPAPVGFNTRRAWIVKTTAVHRAPEVGVELEIRAAPFAPHCAEDHFEMFLSFRMRAIERVPGAAPPSAEGDFVRAQGLAIGVRDEPVRMPLEQMRLLFGDEWSDPDRGLEATFANLTEHALYIAAE